MAKKDPRQLEILAMLNPQAGKRLWFGGASPVGCLRGISAQKARWQPAPERHSIWELTLHIAYWKYAVRRILDDLPKGGFSRSPSNWPRMPKAADERSWKDDRKLLRLEHQQFVETVERLDPKGIDRKASGSGTYRVIDLLNGIIMHDAYHVGQIQILKRLYQSLRKSA